MLPFQVGLSTIAGLLPLLFKQSYLAMVFLKTIVVVVLLGMFHGLVILPAVLTLFTRRPSPISPPTEEGKSTTKSTAALSVVESGFGSGASSACEGSDGSDSSERSSQRSSTNERKTSFYKVSPFYSRTGPSGDGGLFQNQQFIKFLNDLGIFHSLTATSNNNSSNKESERRERKPHLKKFSFTAKEQREVAGMPEARVDSGGAGPTSAELAPATALVHRITLGRTNSLNSL